MRPLFILIMVLSLWTDVTYSNEVIPSDPSCSPLLSEPSSAVADTKSILALMSFLHPMQKNALVGVESFAGIYFLVHWSGGFVFPTDPLLYNQATEYRLNSMPFEHLLSYRGKKFVNRPEFFDQFVRYLGADEKDPRPEIQRVLRTRIEEFQAGTDVGVWNITDQAVRESRAALLLDGFFAHLSKLPGTPAGTSIVQTLSRAELSELHRLKIRLESPPFRSQVLREVIALYPQLLIRRNDFRVRVFLGSMKDNPNDLVEVRKQFDPGRLRLKSFLLRETDVSKKLAQEIGAIESRREVRSQPELPKIESFQVATHELIERRQALTLADAFTYAQTARRDIPLLLAKLDQKVSADFENSVQDNPNLAVEQIVRWRDLLDAELQFFENVLAIIEDHLSLIDFAVPRLRAHLQDSPKSSPDAETLRNSSGQERLLQVEALRSMLNLFRPGLEARHRLNLNRLNYLAEREMKILGEISFRFTQ